MVDFISSLLLVRFQQKVEVHGGRHLPEATFKANNDEARSHEAKSHAFGHEVWKEKKQKVKKLKIIRDKLGSAEKRENVAYMKPPGETDVLEQLLIKSKWKFKPGINFSLLWHNFIWD